MSEPLLPMTLSQADATQPPAPRTAPRMQRVNRDQVLLQPSHLESLLPPDHRARVVWGFVSKADSSSFHERIESREGRGGRPAFDPAVLLTLWI